MGLFSKPEVVIAKESSNAKEYLRQLEELAEKAAGENAKKIAKEIAVVKSVRQYRDQQQGRFYPHNSLRRSVL